MPRFLTTRPYRVALSGKTADGRTISAQDLRDMAEQYNPELYTASIWIEHERWWNTVGTVYSLEAKDEDNGKVGLYAQLRPNQFLLDLNNRGEKLFPSIEISPDFADTAKPYMTGLAVTDQPASLGTEQLYFSQLKTPFNNANSFYYSMNFELPKFSSEDPITEQGLIKSFIYRLFGLNSDHQTENLPMLKPKLTKPQPSTIKPPRKFSFDSDSLATFASFADQIVALGAAMREVIDNANADPTPPSQDVADAIETVKDAAEVVVEDAKEKEELSRKQLADEIFKQVMEQVKQTPVAGQSYKQCVTSQDVETKKRVL